MGKVTFSIICFLMIIFFSCIYKSVWNKITRIKVSVISPDKVIENKGMSFIYDFYITYYGTYRIYELPYHKTYEIDNILIYDSTKFEYFICNPQNKYGYLLKTIKDSFTNKHRTDSLLQKRALGGTWDMADFFKEVKVKTVEKLKSLNESEVYKYVFESEIYDSAYLFYKKSLLSD